MTVPGISTGSYRTAIAEAREALDRWDVAACRKALSRARSQASGWGDAHAVALATVLEARAAQLLAARPSRALLGTEIGDALDSEVESALLRFDAELALGAEARPERSPPALAESSPVDKIATAVLLALPRLGDAGAAAPRIAGATTVADREDAGGWQYLVQAVEAEARGASGWAANERALAVAERSGARALEWAALTMRAALGARRGAHGEERSALERMAKLLESWALALPPADAASAMARPDRVSVLRAVRGDDAGTDRRAHRLVELALAMGQERDTERLVALALDAAIAATRAERGVLLLADGRGGHRCAGTRFIDGRAEREGVLGLSSSIAQRALAAGEAIISNDVHSDPRLGDCASVALDVTSVLCAPIHARAEIEGALYLDRRTRGRAFDESAVEAARAVGAMLASALLTARVIADLEAARSELADALAARTVERDEVRRQLSEARDYVPAGKKQLVGRGPEMRRLVATIGRVAGSDVPVLITGETGSGKELVAHALHDASARRDRPFVAVNCGALSENLLESELFGAERGAYTNAVQSRPGLFVAAHGGTLFLDEVGDMPPAMQVALLRALESGEIRAVGSSKSRKVDVRVIAASNRDLAEQVALGRFRADLYYRLEVVRIHVPPLRERLDDLPELAEHLLAEVRHRYGLPTRHLSKQALELLRQRRWPGNVRELRHVLASAALAAVGPAIDPADLPAERSAEPPGSPLPVAGVEGFPEDGHQARADAIRRALRATAGHRARAAQILGVSRSTFYRYLELYRIDPSTFDVPLFDDDSD